MSEVRYGRRNPWRSFESSILEDTRFTTVETLVYIVIESHATTTDQRSFPSYNTIARKAKCSRASSIRAVKKLADHNLLYKIERYKEEIDNETREVKIENTSNLYVIFPSSAPFDPENEWIDQNGIVHEKGVVSDVHHPSITGTPPLVSQVHHPSITGTPGVVSQVHPNKTISNKTKLIKPIINKTTYQQSEIAAAQQEVSATKEIDMVVVETKSDVVNNFKTDLSNQEITRLIKHATKHNKNLSEVIQATKEHFLSTKKPINDLVASLMHGITNGWDKPKKTVVGKPLPKSIAEAKLSEVPDMQPEEDEEGLEDTYADIQATMARLRSTEKQILN